jgi:hypothetical protein
MGADPIRPRAARHAVMAAYYQIAGAAERSLSPALIGGPAGRRVDGAGPRRQKPILKKGQTVRSARATKLKPRERACHLQRTGAHLAPPRWRGFFCSTQSLRDS